MMRVDWWLFSELPFIFASTGGGIGVRTPDYDARRYDGPLMARHLGEIVHTTLKKTRWRSKVDIYARIAVFRGLFTNSIANCTGFIPIRNLVTGI